MYKYTYIYVYTYIAMVISIRRPSFICASNSFGVIVYGKKADTVINNIVNIDEEQCGRKERSINHSDMFGWPRLPVDSR